MSVADVEDEDIAVEAGGRQRGTRPAALRFALSSSTEAAGLPVRGLDLLQVPLDAPADGGRATARGGAGVRRPAWAERVAAHGRRAAALTGVGQRVQRAMYPLGVNMHSAIPWHPDVNTGTLIKKEHDLHLLKVLLTGS